MILNYLIVNNLLISLGGNCTIKSINNTETFEKIIAVDSGYEHLTKHDLKPDILIGDLDSVNKELINIAKSEGVEIFEFNKDLAMTFILFVTNFERICLYLFINNLFKLRVNLSYQENTHEINYF